jgi:alpha-tubulin suppressor-like RCC1 family protein
MTRRRFNPPTGDQLCRRHSVARRTNVLLLSIARLVKAGHAKLESNSMKILRLTRLTLLALSTFHGPFSTSGAAPTVTQVAGGYYHTLFVESDGSLWAMGYNNYGQLGDGMTNESHVPKLIVASNVVAVAAGAYHSLFLTSDGNLWAMGWNGNGQLGDGTGFDQHSPEQITFNHGVTAIAAGDYHSLYLKTNQLWGMGVAGSLGNGINIGGGDSRSPVLLHSGVSQIAGGNYTSFFIDVNAVFGPRV